MRAFAAFRAVLCLSTALMIAISWPLWVTGGSFPRVPWLGWVRLLPAWASWVRFAILMIVLIAASIPASLTLSRWRPPPELSGAGAKCGWNFRTVALTLALSLSAWLILEDQFRLQPWMYQFLLMGLALAACPRRKATTLCRWLAIAIYFHSGLSKLEPSFLGHTGRSFLLYLTRPFGIEFWSWSKSTGDAATLLIPCWEIGVASALALGARRVGVACAILQHLGLLLILGPWGMSHSANVLIWNVAMAVEVTCLFWSPLGAAERMSPSGRMARTRVAAVSIALIAACLLPFGERGGWWDTWPSFGLYSASDNITIVARGPRVAALDGQLGAGLDPPRMGTAAINLARWSLEERRVPIYPSGRALNGVAEALASRYRGVVTIDVEHYGPRSQRYSGPVPLKLLGHDAIRKFGDTFWLNAHPAR